MTVSAEEKIRQLRQEEVSKRKELEDKKAALEKQRKEVEALEKKSKEAIKETQEEVESTIEELVLAERKDFHAQEETRRKREAIATESLEEKTGPAAPAPIRGYADAISEVIRGAPTFYDLTNYNVINRLETLAGEANSRSLTADERDFVQIVEYHAKNLARDDYYKDKQGANYLKKELAQIDFINTMVKKQEKQGENKDYNV